jgi:hypothetical protein
MPSRIDVVTGADPAANTECSITVPGAGEYVLLYFYVQCVQGATQTPTPRLYLKDGSTILATFPSSSTIAASTTVNCVWAPDLPQLQTGATTDVHLTAPIPQRLTVKSGWTLETVTTGKGANTNYGAPIAIFERVQ